MSKIAEREYDLDDFHDKICDLEYEGKIDHATMCNAIRYLEGDYQLRNHTLCRNAFMRCKALFS